MPVRGLDRQYEQAVEIALAIIDVGDTAVTAAQMRAWRPDDLYDWLTFWGYEWRGSSWDLPQA